MKGRVEHETNLALLSFRPPQAINAAKQEMWHAQKNEDQLRFEKSEAESKTVSLNNQVLCTGLCRLACCRAGYSQLHTVPLSSSALIL